VYKQHKGRDTRPVRATSLKESVPGRPLLCYREPHPLQFKGAGLDARGCKTIWLHKCYAYSNLFPNTIQSRSALPLMARTKPRGLVKRGHRPSSHPGMPSYPRRRIYPNMKTELYFTEEHKGVTDTAICASTAPPQPARPTLLDGSFVASSAVKPSGLASRRNFLDNAPLPICVPVAFAWIRALARSSSAFQGHRLRQPPRVGLVKTDY